MNKYSKMNETNKLQTLPGDLVTAVTSVGPASESNYHYHRHHHS